MWSTSLGGYSVRSILIFVLAVISTVLLWATIASTPANAADASWKGESIIYDTRQYFPLGQAVEGDSHGLPVGSQVYISTEVIDQNTGARKAYVIYFAPGTSPPTETTATYVEYDYSDDDVFSNPQNSQSITVTIQGAESSYSSCSVEGIGWFVCPITVFLADAMDSLFIMIAGFVAVQPIPVNDTSSPLYVSWSVMLNIANVAFIIMALIIIYSQVTGIGINNYGIKKLLPRLFITAILVNLSFYITAIAVDLSNIAGFSLQEILIRIRQDTFAITGETWTDDTTTWSNITGLILSGGAVTAGVIAGSVATVGDLGVALYMLVPLLIGLVLTVIFVLLILAARQAIIVILIVISPLAFVANLLPNTEKWFDKWRDLFMNMLIFFPAFALVFGGSQLAGGIIIQNANNIVMMLFGMAVQIAPLVITPLILKLSGGILGRIAGLLNDPRKGVLDRSKHWANDRAKMRRMESLEKTKGAARLNPFRRIGQRFDTGNKYVKQRTDNAEKANEARYLATPQARRAHDRAHDVNTDHTIAEKRLERDLHQRVTANPDRFAHARRAEAMTEDEANAKLNLDNALSEMKSGNVPVGMRGNVEISALAAQAQRLAQQKAAQDRRGQAADGELQKKIAEAFNVELKEDGSNRAEYIASQALLRTAGGVQGQIGITRAQASAAATLTRLNKEALENNISLIGDQATARGEQTVDFAKKLLALANSDKAAERNSLTQDQVEAAMELLAQDGQVNSIEFGRGSMHIDQSIVDRVVSRNVNTMKAKGGFHWQANPDLSLQKYLQMAKKDPARYGENAKKTKEIYDRDLARGKIESFSNTPADSMGSVKAGAFEAFGNSIDDIIKLSKMTPTNTDDLKTLEKLHEAMQIALHDDTLAASMSDRLAPARAIDVRLSDMLGKQPVPPKDRSQPS